jgi:hypothetical protein
VRNAIRSLATLGTSALAVASLTLLTETASALTLPAPTAIPGVPGDLEDAQVAIGPDGTVTAVLVTWDEATDTHRVLAATRPPQGAWTAPRILSGPSQTSTEPAIAIGPDGTTTIAWRLAPADDDDFVVQATTRTPGHDWSPAQPLSQQSTDEYVSGFTNPEVRLAAATDGTVTAVWPQWVTDHFEVQTATRSAAGAWAPAETLDAREWGYRTPELAAGPSGQVAVAYGLTGTGTGANDGVFVRTRQGGGAWSPAKRLGDEYWAGRPDVAYMPDGTLGVVWASGFNTPTVTTLAPGGRWTSPRVISPVHVKIVDLQLAAGSSGFVATWTSDENGNYDDEHVYAAAGGPTGPWAVQPVATATSGSPVVTVKSDGTAVVMWLRKAPGTNDYAVQATLRPPGGGWEAPTPVRTLPADSSVWLLALASGPAGSLVGLWAESDAAGATTTYAVIQDPAAPDTGSIKGPRRIRPGKKGAFVFAGPSGATYECRVDQTRKQQHGRVEGDGKRPVPWKACTSPYRVKAKKLKPGKHTVYVRAVQFGLTDPTPSARKFKVK